MPNSPEYYFQKGLDSINKANALSSHPDWEYVHCKIDAAHFLEKSAQMGYIKAMMYIYIYDKKLDYFDCGLKTDPILWLTEYIERTNLQINETISLSDIVNDILLQWISIEDLIVMRQNSDSSKVQDFCDKLERIIIQEYNSSL